MILIVFCALLVLLIILSLLGSSVESFTSFNVGTRMRCPTRNQSYDLRGEAAILPRTELPTNNSGFGPLEPNNCTQRSVEIL